jgi:hypothetical protein
MGQKTNPIGIRASFIQQNFFFTIKRFRSHSVNINSFFFDFSLGTRKIAFGERTFQFFLIRQLFNYYATKLFCVINEIRTRETSLSVFIFVEFFDIKDFTDSKNFAKVSEREVSFSTFFTFLQKHAEVTVFIKKPVKVFYISVSDCFSIAPEMTAYLKKKTSKLPAIYPVYFLGFICNAFPGSAAFSKVVALALEKNVKHSQVIETVNQLFDFLFQLKNTNFKGLRLQVSGRINGVDMAKKQVVSYGSVPLQTMSSFISYNHTAAFTPFGVCGIKTWFCYKKKTIF